MSSRAAVLTRVVMLAAALLGFAAPAGAQQLMVGRAGPKSASSILARELAAPHVVIAPDTVAPDIRADSAYSTGVIVLGRDVTVNGTVHGDLTVIGGDLYMHPGGHVDGRAVAIGGAVYNSSLATIRGAQESYRDFTYAITPLSSGYILDYESLVVERHGIALPSWLGFGLPSYDRTDGLSVPISLNLGIGSGAVQIQPLVVYRSELGRLDPQLQVAVPAGSEWQFTAAAGRTTLTNDEWIRSDLANSVESFVLGNDSRNYYRANFLEGRATRLWNPASGTVQAYVGARFERDRSVRPALFATGGPWSILGRHDSTHMLRPNPQVPAGDLAAGSGGVSVTWEAGGVTTTASLDEELSGFSSTVLTVGGPRKASAGTTSQTTLDATVSFATFGAQHFTEHAHGVATAGATTPLERYVYLGGPGTISTLDMLSMGGDDLLFLDSRYALPISRIQLPMVGPPLLILRHVLGAAGVRGLPALEQAVGVRVAVSVLYGEVMVDPASHHVHVGAGISMSH